MCFYGEIICCLGSTLKYSRKNESGGWVPLQGTRVAPRGTTGARPHGAGGSEESARRRTGPRGRRMHRDRWGGGLPGAGL